MRLVKKSESFSHPLESIALKQGVPSQARGGVMTQGAQPVIHGAEWTPSGALTFSQPLLVDAARAEVMRFFTERHEGHVFLAANVWDHLHVDGQHSFDGESWNTFGERFIDAFKRGFEAQNSHKISTILDQEVMPRRSIDEHLQRRLSHLIIDLRLCLRRLAHYMSTTMEQRMEWQRMMTRTRAMDAHLKEVFFSGMETPDGSRFGGKGFRSTWQEGVVAVATALKRAEIPDKSHTPGNGYDGDLVAPMIRDVGLALAMGDTVVDVMAAQMGKAGSNQNGGHEGAGGRDLHIGACRSYNKKGVNLICDRLDRHLAVGCCITDVFFVWANNLWKTILKGGHNIGRIINGQSGLRHIGQAIRVTYIQFCDILNRFNQ